MEDYSDEKLMELVQKGKLNFMELLFSRYQKKLYNYFFKCTMDTEESRDLTQITFIRIMKYRASYNPSRGFQVWLFQIARNLVKDHFRKMKVYRDQFNLVDHLPEHAMEEDTTGEIIEKENKLHEALAKLDPDKRELIVMSKFQGMKYDQIAAIREVSVSAIKVQVHRTIAKLRELYFENDKNE